MCDSRLRFDDQPRAPAGDAEDVGRGIANDAGDRSSVRRLFNARYRRTGTLWEGRFKAALVGSARYALACYRYIELNPVRAQMVATPSDYPWSSHGHNALGRNQALITPHAAWSGLGDTDETRHARYLALVNEQPQPEELEEIRRCTQQQRVYANQRLQLQVEALTHRAAAPRPRGRPRAESHAEK